MDSTASVITGGLDPKALIEEMRRQNEAMLAAHKLQIEQQYQEQMQKFMQQFAPPPRNSGQGLVAQIKAKRPVIQDTDADKETSKFYEQAKDRKAAPLFEQFENDKKTHIVRAVAEGSGQNSYVVRTSGDNQDVVTPAPKKNIESSSGNLVKRHADLPPSLRNNPLEKSVAPASWKKVIQDKKHEKKKSVELAEVAHAEDFEINSANGAKNVGSSDEEFGEELFHKYDDATQFMLKKTAFLVSETKEYQRKEIAKQHKLKKKITKQKLQFSSDISDYMEPKDHQDGPLQEVVEEEEGANGRDDSAKTPFRLPSVRMTTPTQGQSNPVKNILVKSVEFAEPVLPVIEPKPPAIHPDYQWDGELRVNNFEYKVDPHLALHKSEWENEIARHILSVYATSHSNVDVKESKSILKYVDVNRDETHQGVETYVRSPDGRGPKSDEYDQTFEDEDIEGGEVVDQETLEPIDEVEDNEDIKIKTKGKRKTTKSQRRVSDASDSSTVSRHPSHQPGMKTAKEGGLEMTHVEKSFRNHSKYRSCLLVRVGRTGKKPGAPNSEGKEISIRGSPRVFPIWFVTSGEVYSNWARLPGGEKLQAQLFNLYEKGFFKEYLGILEKTIDGMWRNRHVGKIDGIEAFLNPRHSTRKRVQLDDNVRLVGKDGKVIQKLKDHTVKEVIKETKKPDFVTGAGTWPDDNPDGNVWHQIAADEKQEEAKRAELSDDELISLWGQLILTANAFGIMLIERKDYDLALEILQRAEGWCKRSDFLPKAVRKEIMPHICDALAFYFYKRGKNMSAMTYTNLAIADHEELGNLDNVCVCMLHIAAIQSQGGEFKEAHKMLYHVLAMVEDGRLAFANATPKQLCLVAVAYHNLAVVQMKLLVPDLACKSSQNARKIARLCLSYSNRWIKTFQWTHEAAMEDIRFQLTLKPKIPLNDQQLHVIKELTADMYNPEAD